MRTLPRAVIALCLCLCTCAGTMAGELSLRVEGPARIVGEVRERLATRLPGWQLDGGDSAQVVVAVGSGAFAAALEAQRGKPAPLPVVAIALGRQAWLQQVRPGDRATALFWEPDPQRQLALARLLMPGARRAGILLGAPDEALVAALRREAQRQGLELVIGELAPGESLSRRLNSVLAQSDFLLGIDDARVFTPELAKTVLLTAYRHGKPVVGPTGAWVGAGAVASLTSSLEAATDEVAAWLSSMPAAANALPPPRYATRYGIATNEQVARSLQLSLPSAAGLDAIAREPAAGKGVTP